LREIIFGSPNLFENTYLPGSKLKKVQLGDKRCNEFQSLRPYIERENSGNPAAFQTGVMAIISLIFLAFEK
jgi:hypothetical protein